jgi:hypothetical protein
MPNPTPKKVAGKVTPPPSQADFNKRPLGKYCRSVTGMFRRLHVINPATRQPWPPIYFSRAGNTRFDPVGGIGTMCVGESLGGAILEKFDDRFGPEGDDSRSLTETELRETWETLVYLPVVQLFDATGKNLSLIRADAQFAVGEYSITREWALRMMFHPDQVDGIFFPSRHDLERKNIAIFGRPRFAKTQCYDPGLSVPNIGTWNAKPAEAGELIYGPAQVLKHHPELRATVDGLLVGIPP